MRALVFRNGNGSIHALSDGRRQQIDFSAPGEMLSDVLSLQEESRSRKLSLLRQPKLSHHAARGDIFWRLRPIFATTYLLFFVRSSRGSAKIRHGLSALSAPLISLRMPCTLSVMRFAT